VAEPGGTTTVVFAGGGGLLLLMQPDIIDTAIKALNRIFIARAPELFKSLIGADYPFESRSPGSGRLRISLSSHVLQALCAI
jgi:hypothetical protein